MDEQKPLLPNFPIVALGASAGGLDALNVFFEAMPANSGFAFVVVQHLSPNQESILHELIQRHTTINVQRIIDNCVVQPDEIYVLPAGFALSIEANHLVLTPMAETQGWPETINHFFKSLALDRKMQACAVVLSGAGHDGTAGARAIKDAGGLVIAQDLESAAQNSMPFNVIDAGLATAILSPELMPEYIMGHFGLTQPDILGFEDLTEVIAENDINKVLSHLRQNTSYDFHDYKTSTLRRQIARRMGANQVNTVDGYLTLMVKQPDEAHQLVKGLLIHVTSFFRDPDAFEALKNNGLMPLLKTLSIDTVFRVWVPGCASGEEAVSIAILIYECLRELNMTEMEIRIFATDINGDMVKKARNGIYPLAIAENITSASLKDYFIKTDDNYQVRTHILRMIVWAEHNLAQHPPFSNLHLISCRNVLIYFQQQLQDRIRALFQFALLANGILFLGSSEAVPQPTDMFTAIDSKQKIYRRAPGSPNKWMHLERPLFRSTITHEEEPVANPKSPQRNSDELRLQLTKDMLLTYYNSTCAIVDENYQVRFTYGEIDQYLRLVPGSTNQHNIMYMAREGLDTELTIALHEVFDKNDTFIRSGVWVKTNGDQRIINLIVKPIQESTDSFRQALIIFELATKSADSRSLSPGNVDPEEGATISRLREELQQARQALQTTTQALQAKSEELTSSMEEISSANEEVQTTNEELRTSKEELESMNEELNTLNSQLSNQNTELTHANNALFNFLQSTEIGIVFLDQNLAIREYTQAATNIYSLRKSDVGRPLSEITSHLVSENMIAEATRVLDTLVNVELEARTTVGSWYKVEIRPYRTINSVIDGLVLTFTDVTVQKQAEHEADASAIYIREIVNTVDNSLLELDKDLRVTAANSAFYEQFETREEDTVGKLVYELGNGQWNIPDLRRLLSEVIPEQTSIRNYVVAWDFPGIGQRSMQLNATQNKEMNRIVLVITEVSK